MEIDYSFILYKIRKRPGTAGLVSNNNNAWFNSESIYNYK